ncbi:hypothetical protein CHCC20373_4488 [Bacillus licheniformis]|nr:hypothetical protein CHCC20373_4488 [Bacillus licheniformis]TWN58342.1 hypothetical protein CHCC14437_1983 [Bacillus licheniformis]
MLNVNSPFLRGLKPLLFFISGLFMLEAKSMLPVPIKANKGRQ